jgi:thiamine-phosphate diphosphorylase
MPDWSLCVITRRGAPGRDHLDIARAALRGGARLIQLRDKEMSGRALLEAARRLADLAHGHGGVLIVNDRLDVALAAGADGVHLGEEDLPIAAARRVLGDEAIIGASVANAQQAAEAEAAGATYVSVGSVFPTGSKADAGEPIGLAAVREVKRKVRLPVLAIGGISRDNVTEVIRAGADGVAVISAVASADDMERATAELLRLIADARRTQAE